ncbi:MAG: DUF5916 domain-containing protein [Gammaproteobacteria bacterium]|jgi:hypothetical protein
MRVLFSASLVLVCTGLCAQEGPRNPGTKSVSLVRTDTPPVIDGQLDDAVWAQAAYIDDLHQVRPVEYAEPSEPTEIYILYDDNALYVGARMHMADPALITANVMRQYGSQMTQDDTLFVTLDPFNSKRSGYFFGINANGVRQDGLYQNVSEFYGDWDTIYYAQAAITDEGWTAEFEIPFKSISFDPSADTWGLNFSRSIQFRNEDIAWVTRNRRWDPSSAGLATGLEGLQQGVGLDVIPSISLRRSKRFGNETETNPNLRFNSSVERNYEPSLDVVYKLTSALNASMTVNTDFSATEVDDRQVNLTRFGLFFPEKRDFFLREADIFEFGRIGAQDGNGAISGATRQNGRPFFSRRIGLAPDGSTVDLEVGGKVSGRVGRWDIGALSIRQDAYRFSRARTDPQNGQPVVERFDVAADSLSVVRAKAGIGEESTVGLILTDGDPRSNEENRLYGIDYLYRDSDFANGKTLEAVAWYQGTQTPGLAADDAAFGLGVSLPSQAGVRAGLAAREVQRNFNPALGFVDRTDVRSYSGNLGYTHRPATGYWQQMFFGIDGERIENIAGGLQSQRLGLTPFQMTSRSGDVLYALFLFEKEVLTQDFEISPGIVIPAGAYSFDDYGIEWRASTHRKFSGRIIYTAGAFYDGTRERLISNVVWQPSPRFRSSIGFNINDIELPGGAFTTRLVTAGLDVVFSSTLSWVNLIQYDNISETMGVNMRLHWVPEDGRELFFVVNQTLEDFDRDNSFHSVFSDITLKAGYTFRF